MNETKMDKKPLCPYCGVEWKEKMLKVEINDDFSSCDCCGPTLAIDVILDITCWNCNKLIYRKEGSHYEFDDSNL